MPAYNKIGFLLSSSGGATATIGKGKQKRNFGIGDYVRMLDEAGIPAVVACNDGNGGIADALALIKNGSTVPHVLGYRIVSPDHHPVEYYSVPDYLMEPAAAARRHFDLLKPVITKKKDLPANREHLWWFPINEIRAKRAVDKKTGKKEPQYNDMAAWDWMGEFCYEFALLANGEEYKVALPMANSGEPQLAALDDVQIDAWKLPGMKRFLQLCAERPHMVCVGLHEYSWEINDDKGGIKAGYPTKVGRFQYLFRACDEMGIARPNVIFGEWGWKHDRTPPPEVAIRHIREIAELYARHPQILGAFIWYLGKYNNSSVINDLTVKLIEPVARKTCEWRFPDPKLNGALDIATHAIPQPADEIKPVIDTPQETETGSIPGDQSLFGVIDAEVVGLNLRSEPDTRQGNDSIIVRLDHGTRVKILAQVADMDENSSRIWYQVEASGTIGYVAASYVNVDASAVEKADDAETPPDVIGIKPKTGVLETGMNINPDAPHSNPVSTEVLKGMDWVRLVFKLDDRRVEERGDLQKAFAQYDPIVKGYNEQGVKTLFIINQETRQPGNTHANWREAQHWSAYCRHLADTAGKIAARYAGYGSAVAYQIWNEGDKQYKKNQTEVENIPSLFLPPAAMAEMVREVAQAIRANGPQAQIVFNGMAESIDVIIQYLQTCKQALGGSWPVDALALHPYTFVATREGAPFDWANKGNFLKDAFRRFEDAFPGMPIWITELGVAVDNKDKHAVSTDHAYREIAKYLRDTYRNVSLHHAVQVPVLIWFAWSDNMRNAGMVQSDGREKPHLFAAFKNVRDRTIF